MDMLYTMLIVILVVGHCCGMGDITRSLYSNKGHKGGFALGFFLGPIGLLIAMWRGYAKPYEDPQAHLKNAGAWYCPKCGNHHAAYERSCSCGMEKATVKADFEKVSCLPEA